MYQPDTILVLKEPRSTFNEDGTPNVLFPYDRVKVINQSPIDHGLTSAAWTGSNGQGVIVTPLTAFESTIDEPYGKLQRLYEVEQLPDRVIEVKARVEYITPDEAGPSPEDVFAAVAEELGDDGRATKVRAPIVSPLDGEVIGEEKPVDTSPIGPLEVTDVPAEPDVGVGRSPLDG